MIKIKDEDFDIEKIADSGQCFRMNRMPDGSWTAVAGDKCCSIREYADKAAVIECPEEDDVFWKEYFDLDTDYSKYRSAADTSDAFLTAACEYGKGIRILKQDPWEMLISFIISQRKNIPAIQSCVEKMCMKWGTKTVRGIFAFPTPEQLSKATLDELSCCSLGYRAEYVYLAAKAVATGEKDLETFKMLSDEDLLCALLGFKGVGVKVANCVSLFGYHRIGAFPIDVWIDRVQKEYYEGRFPVEKYEGFAGVMQQYIFFYARKVKLKI